MCLNVSMCMCARASSASLHGSASSFLSFSVHEPESIRNVLLVGVNVSVEYVLCGMLACVNDACVCE